ncbi:hypothetical protein ACFE04_019248 [Oxalis oulophora]
MASFRRSLSATPKSVDILNKEMSPLSSPLSKSDNNSYLSFRGFLSSLFCLLDFQPFSLGVFSTRSSRLTEKSKPKSQFWRRALLHFFIFFILGLFYGLSPFTPMNSSANLMPKHEHEQQAFPFEMISSTDNFHTVDDNTSYTTPMLNDNVAQNNITSNNQPATEESLMETRKLLIIVTPTNNQSFQSHYLNRLAHTLKLVPPPLLWIVVEMTAQSEDIADILRRTGIMYRHLVYNNKVLTGVKDRRLEQRNAALSHIEKHNLDGIVYFADYDNIYSPNLFDHMREIRRFGTWPVAQLIGDNSKAIWDGPVCNGTEVIGWHLNEVSRRFRRYRRFHAEMSGFAFNSTILWDPKRWHRPTLEPIRQVDTVKDGFQVSAFIEQLVEDESQMEGLLPNCSRIMVWRVQLEASESYSNSWIMKNNLDVVDPLS